MRRFGFRDSEVDEDMVGGWQNEAIYPASVMEDLECD